MADYEDETDAPPVAESETAGAEEKDEGQHQLVETLTERVRADKRHHKKSFAQMKEDMEIARRGAPKAWPEDSYVANITGRHINNMVAALYAKNPKAVARRRDRLDFQMWDERPQSLMEAMQLLQQAATAPGDPMLAMAAQQAQALIQDAQQGIMAREQTERIGRTLEVLFSYYTKEQKPLDFKTGMKQLVRRALTTGVGYAVCKFQREMEQDPDIANQLADHRRQIAYLKDAIETARKPDSETEDSQGRLKELELSLQSLIEQEYVLVREGLVFDFPESTRVIPDKMTRQIHGFVGSRWLTIEYLYTPEEVKQVFGKDLGKGYRPHDSNGSARFEGTAYEYEVESGDTDDMVKRGDLVCVWEHYDKRTGVVYYLADGCREFLREPGPPDVYVEDFWPVFTLTFNEVEDPDCCFPPSDVRLMMPMQEEWNRSRQGAREHRIAGRPRWATPNGAMSDEDKIKLSGSDPFTVTELQALQPGQSVQDVLQPIPVPGVDPNLYQVGEIMTDVQFVVGAQEAAFGAVTSASATESSIAEAARSATLSSKVDDLDSFLTDLARACGQIMMKELDPETVMKIAGPGAVWPQLTLEELASEVYLEIEAGSSGKPNQAQEIRNWQDMLPFLIQMPSIAPDWLARETLSRLDDRMDLTDALVSGMPSIVTQNRMQQAGPSDPGAAPEQQGGEGVQNEAPSPGGSEGTGPGMGGVPQ